jgi:lipopolysaccharide/colanic/teichoic acid biosynthesis glycosyltransferase
MVPMTLQRSQFRSRLTDTHTAQGPTLLSEDLFRGALIRERKRADRSNQPLALVVLGFDDCLPPEPVLAWSGIIHALDAARGETDILGWLEHQRAAGLILPEVPASDSTFMSGLESCIRRELARRLDPSTVDRLSVRLLVHPEPDGMAEAIESVDPLLSELQPRTRVDLINSVLKRSLDIVGSFLLLVLLTPLILVLAALVKLTSRGPVLIRQVRIGEQAREFTMLKFRSMRVNASATIHRDYVTSFIKGNGQSQANVGSGGVFKLTKDPRITPFGHFLRKTSLDELPQLWNVLRGDMSLVGPRPPLQYEVEQYQPWHLRRVLEAKPGITGLWQVKGRSRTTFDDMVRLDLRYARTSSVWTDVKILIATPGAVIAGKGAC